MRASGMTQEQVAGAAQMQVAVYSRIERAEVDPRWGSIVKIASALNVPMRDLATGTDAR